jgi:1-acyl-sn-glycerol-3-phosphate acyltransferase
MSPYLMAAAGVLLAAILCAAWLWHIARLVTPEEMTVLEFARKIQKSGYLPPPPNAYASRQYMKFCRLAVWLQVGEWEVEGRENLEVDGPCIYVGPHATWVDPCVFPVIMGRQMRHLAASPLFKMLFGLIGVFLAASGSLSTGRTPGSKGSGTTVSVAALVEQFAQLVVFPEGGTNLTGELGELHTGVVRIIKEAAALLNKPLCIVICDIRYGRYPGPWIKHLPALWAFLLLFLLAPIYRRGVKVTVRRKLWSNQLPEDDKEATTLIRRIMLGAE